MENPMLQELQAYNGFELLCSQLSLNMDELNAQIKDDPRKILDQVEALAAGALAMPLEQDLQLKGSDSAFITRGTDLHQNLGKLIQRMARGAELKAPPIIAPTEEITTFLQEKVGASFNRLIKGVMGNITVGRIAQIYDKDRELKMVAQHFGEVVSLYLSKPMMLSPFLQAFTSDGPLDLMEKNTRSAFVAMAALRYHENTQMLTSNYRRRQLVEMGLAVLFQDVFCLIEGVTHVDEDPEHASRSADIAHQIGLPVNCIATIRHHHRTMDTDGAPILKNQVPSLPENMAAVTNAFIHCLTTESLALDINQSLYVLSYYADGLYFAKDCVQALGRICIGERKQQILTKALQFIKQCPHGERPFLWDVRTAVPNRFLCQNSRCEHLTNEMVTLYHGLLFDGPDQGLHVPKGHYRKCGHITKLFNCWLLELFQDAVMN
jgi:hypothetical protein